MAHKIAIIGAGSAIFSLNLIKDLCINEQLKDFTVSLMDIDTERLDAIANLARRYLKETHHDLKVEKTTNRRACLQGADFVIHVALDYGHARMKEGWDIARRHGYRFGGSLHIVHDEAFWVNFYQLRLMESVLLDVLDICPEAYFISVANPVQAGVTYLKRKYPAANIVGLCHGYKDVDRLSRAIGIDPTETSYEVCGVNHFIWLTKYYQNGEDAYPVLNRWIESGGADKHLQKQGCKSINEGPKAIDLYKRYGVFPIGDTCTPGGGSWGWWYHTPEAEERYAEDPRAWYDQYFTLCDTTIRKIRAVVDDPDQSVVEAFSNEPSVEPMIPLIEAIACDRERVIIVNILNTG